MRGRSQYHFCAVLVCLCSLRAGLIAGGLDAPSISARGAGMGGAMTALTGNPTFAYVNPASLTYLDGLQFSIGTTVGLPNYQFAPAASPSLSTKMQTQVLFPPNLCLTYTFETGFGVGVSVTIPYSNKTGWGSDWVGRTVTVSSEMRGFVVTPMASLDLSKSLAVGIGVNITSYRLSRSERVASLSATNGSAIEGTESMQGASDPGYGVQLGLLYFPSEFLGFGLAYKSRCDVSVDEGAVTYDWSATPTDAALTKETKFRTSVTLPDRIQGGLSIRPFRFLLFTGELEYARWSSIGTQIVTVGDPATRLLVEQQGWKDAMTIHAGAEVVLGDIALRGGFIIDHTPIIDAQLRPSAPDADRFAITAGVGYKVEEGLMLDFALQSIRYSDRTITTSAIMGADGLPLNGTYTMNATVVGLNLSYSWN